MKLGLNREVLKKFLLGGFLLIIFELLDSAEIFFYLLIRTHNPLFFIFCFFGFIGSIFFAGWFLTKVFFDEKDVPSIP